VTASSEAWGWRSDMLKTTNSGQTPMSSRVEKRKTERIPDISFRLMNCIFHIIDFIYPYIDRRVKKFSIKEGMTVVDYGCGPGRYTTRLARLVGEKGKVFAIDIHELAIKAVKKKVNRYGLTNIESILVSGYNSTLPDEIADMVCAVDMFFIIQKPTEFLGELKRIIKNDGTLIIDSSHEPRSVTKEKILDSGFWDIYKETKDHLKCKPRLN
jgi:ubiquinone/menaquinone biosynthesis C-methylase UbiE